MAASVSALTQAFAFDNNTSTLATVGGANAAFPSINSGLTQNGIDGSTVPEAPDNSATSLTAGNHYSIWSGNFAASATYDLSATDSSISFHFRNLSPGYTVIASTSDAVWLILFSGSGTTNYGRWHFDGTTLKNGDWHVITAQGTPDATGGTFDDTDVTGVGLAVESDTTGGAFGFQIALDQCVVHEGPVVLEDSGGAATVDLNDYYDLLKATGGQTYHSNLVAIAGTTIEFGFPVDIRSDDYDDTTTPYGTGFKDGDGVGYPDMPSGFFQLLITGQASGDQDYGANAVATLSTAYDLTIDAGATSTTIDISDRVFSVVNDAVVGGSGLTLSNVSIISPATCDISDYAGTLTVTGSVADIQWTADLTASASLTTDSNIDITFAETDLSDITVTLTANNTITVSPTTGSGTYDLSGLTTTGTVNLDNSTANNTTITLPAGTSNTVESPTTGGGTITVDSPAVTFTINSSESSSLIQIFTTNTQTVLSSTTGSSLAYEHSAETVDYVIQKAGFLPQRVTGSALSGTSSVTINLVADPIYNASHGLTTVTDYNYSASTRVMTIVANQEGRDLYSALIDDFISETGYRNCPFPLTAIGPDRIDFNAVGYYNTATTVGATIDSGDIAFWKGAGMQWEHDTTGNPTKKFYSIKSSNTLQASAVVGYTQVVTGTPVESTLVSNQVNQVIQYFEDTNGDGTPDYNYTGHLLFKGFLTGYYQARWDVINDGGVTSLEPYEYNIALTQDAIAGTTGDQTITIATLTDHTGAPISVGGKSFDYEMVDPGTNDADNLLAQTNYDVYSAVNASISGSIYTSYQAFDLPDLLVEAGSNIETERGYFEGDGLVTDLSGVYLSRSSSDHPGITRFQSNDGTYYTPAVTSNITFTGLSNDGANIRLQVANETAESASAWAGTTVYAQKAKVLRSTGVGTESTAGLYYVATTGGTSGASEPTFPTSVGSTVVDGTVTWTCYAVLYYDSDPAGTGWSDSYIDGEEFDTGDTYRYRYADMDGATTFKIASGTGIVSSTGFTVAVSPTANAVYATNGHDGRATAITDIYTADYTNDYFVLDANLDFTNPKSFAFYCGELTTSQGMHEIWGAVTAIDAANYYNDVSIAAISFDETGGFVKQEDSDTSRWYRSDDTRPYKDPSTGGAGLAMNWKNPVYTANASDAIYTEASPEPTSVPASNAPLSDKIDFMFAVMRNKGTQTSTTKTIRNDSDTADIASAAVSNDGTTFTKQEYL